MCTQFLEKGYIPFDLRKAQQLVEPDAQGVLQLGIAGQFGISPLDRPLFDSLHECPANALLPNGWLNEPAFEIRHRRNGSAINVITPKRHFRESNQSALFILSHKYDAVGTQYLADFQLVFLI